MILHRVPDDVGDFVEASVILFLERVEDASLDRLEPVVDVRDSPLKNDVTGVVEKPV